MIDNKPKYLKADFDALGDLVMEMYAPKQTNQTTLNESSYDDDGDRVTEYNTYPAWKRAVKKLDPSASFTGDIDIDGYKGKKFHAEWDGEKGEIRKKIIKEEYFSDVEDEADRIDGDLDYHGVDVGDDSVSVDGEEFEKAGNYPPEFENKTADRPFPYLIKTYNQDTLRNVDVIWLNKSDLSTYDDDVPFSLGSNQELIPITD
jgi:hypothetical protein